jgi:hypothetical protein
LRKTPDFTTWRYLLPVWLHRDEESELLAIPPIPPLDELEAARTDDLALWQLLAPEHLIAPDQIWIDQLRQFSERDLIGSGAMWGMRTAIRIALLHAGQADFVLKSDLHSVGKEALPEWTWIPMLAPLRQEELYPEYLKLTRLVEYWNATAWPSWCQHHENGEISCR